MSVSSTNSQKSAHRLIDTLHELQVIEGLRYGIGWDCERTPRGYFYDLVRRDFRGAILDIVEVKYRDMRWGQYPTIHLSEKKILACLGEAQKLVCAFHFAVLCKSGLYMTRLNRQNTRDLPRKQGGRSDRGLAKDIEILVDIPLNYFSKILTPQLTTDEPNSPL